MKKLTLTLLSFTLTFSMFAGGIVTNTNQSAAWSRMLVRDASTDIDAAFFNPAGLTKLDDGFHLSLSSQTISQTRNIYNDALDENYGGSTFAPVFPDFYAVYKTGKVAFSFGFTPIGGGGTAEFPDGLPAFEMPVSGAADLFAPDVTGYSMDASLEGSSIYFGYQLGVSYEINDMISIYAGGRYVMASNSYTGAMKDISFVANSTGGSVPADDYMNGVADQAYAGATQLYGYADMMEPSLPTYGAYTFDQAIDYANSEGDAATAGAITALRDGLTGLTGADAGDMTINEGHATYNTYGDGYTAQGDMISAGADQMGDGAVDAVQTGSGFTPIVGLNLSLMEEKLNIGIKYEFKTNLELTNETTTDDFGMFPNGEVINADMPAMLSVGVGYKLTDALYATFGFHTYFDKEVGWENVDDIDKGSMEYGLGLEYAISEQLLVSMGWLGTKSGVKDSYHNDLNQSYDTNTLGLGGAYRINDMLNIQLGGYYTFYNEYAIEYDGYSQTYSKTNIGFAIGLDFTFGGGGE